MISAQAVAALSGEQLRQWNDQQPVIGEDFKQWHQNWRQAQDQKQVADQTMTQDLSVFQIREMQRLLTANGYDVGSVGSLDEGTMTALRHFQEAQGLTITGMPNERTLRALVLSGGQFEFFGLSPAYGEKYYDYNEYNCCP
jgi:hypothetical protein